MTQMDDDPRLREEFQRETVGGILGALQSFGDWVAVKPKRLLWLIIGLVSISAFMPVLLALMNPRQAVDFVDRLRMDSMAKKLREAEIQREGQEIDRFLRLMIYNLRERLYASRSVARAYVFMRNREEEVIGITDVFESMDVETQRTGIGQRELPLESIKQTIGYMGSDPGNPRCIAANIDDYDDPDLRAFLSAGGLAASAACPVVNRQGRVVGLVAVSVRSPLENNPELVDRTRDVALRIGGYVERSPQWNAEIERFQKASER